MDAIRPLADKDVKLLQLLKNRHDRQSNNQIIYPWDVARLEAIFKSEMYSFKIFIKQRESYFNLFVFIV